jgi:hypothetical protein
MTTNPFAFVDPWEISTAIDKRMRDDERWQEERRRMEAAEFQRALDREYAPLLKQLAVEDAQVRLADARTRSQFTGPLLESNLAGQRLQQERLSDLLSSERRARDDLRAQAEALLAAEDLQSRDLTDLARLATNVQATPVQRVAAQKALSRGALGRFTSALIGGNEQDALGVLALLPGNPFRVTVDADGRWVAAAPLDPNAVAATLQMMGDSGASARGARAPATGLPIAVMQALAGRSAPQQQQAMGGLPTQQQSVQQAMAAQQEIAEAQRQEEAVRTKRTLFPALGEAMPDSALAALQSEQAPSTEQVAIANAELQAAMNARKKQIRDAIEAATLRQAQIVSEYSQTLERLQKAGANPQETAIAAQLTRTLQVLDEQIKRLEAEMLMIEQDGARVTKALLSRLPTQPTAGLRALENQMRAVETTPGAARRPALPESEADVLLRNFGVMP